MKRRLRKKQMRRHKRAEKLEQVAVGTITAGKINPGAVHFSPLVSRMLSGDQS